MHTVPTPPAPPMPRPRTILSGVQIIAHLASLEGWKLHGDDELVAIEKTYQFAGYLQTMAFVNAVAFVAEQLDHHPELLVGYASCSVRFRTHDLGGISVLDCEAARRVDALLQPAVATA